MTKTTPRPWSVWDATNSHEGPLLIGRRGEQYVCSITGTARAIENAEANAEYIVRAVNCHEDLLDACKDLLCWASPGGLHGQEPDGWSNQARAYCLAARVAIAKAEGN